MRDGYADLKAFLTDMDTGGSTAMAGEALVAVKRALVDGEREYEQKAYYLLARLKDRWVRGDLCDVHAHHELGSGPQYHAVLERLQDRLFERPRSGLGR